MEKSSFERLAAINVNEHTEKKNGLTYLSWAWAVDQLLRADPAANWEYLDPLMFGETMMVRCSVTAFGKTMTSHLPVMDYRNKPIPHPNAFEVNTAMQRCLVKAIALHGLGLYIYAGEDLPEGAEPPAEPPKEPTKPAPRTLRPATYAQWNALSDERKQALSESRAVIENCLKTGADLDAWAEFAPRRTDNEAAEALWSCLDSSQRARMTKAKEYIDSQKEENA